MQKLKVGAISLRSEFGKVNDNLENMEKWAKKAAKKGAELLCFPELCVSGYWLSPLSWKIAEIIPGKSTETIEKLAKNLRVYICAGIAEKESDVVFNTQILVGPEGYIGKYRKIHISPWEYPFRRGGSQLPIFDIGKCKLGISICYDNEFPEISRILALKGAEITIMPFACCENKRKWIDEGGVLIFTRARARDNGVFVIAINSAGKVGKGKERTSFPGYAFIVGPNGEIIAETKGEDNVEKMLIVELDPRVIEKKRMEPHYSLRLRRPELYGELIKMP